MWDSCPVTLLAAVYLVTNDNKMLYMFSLSFLSIQLIYFQILAMLSYFSQDWGDIVISGVIYHMNQILILEYF